MTPWRVLGLALILALQVVEPAAGAAEPRTALVIGNSVYRASPLRNPVNDARAIAGLLQRLEFDVILRENADTPAMRNAIAEFGRRLRKGGIGLFYYAGHGLQVKGLNYLVPVDAEIERQADVGLRTIGVNDVLDQMEEARNRINVVILDACRNNPFPVGARGAARGLAPVDAPNGTLIAYATSPNQVADDGPGEHGLYTEELLKAMPVPGLDVEAMFKQVREGVAARSGDKQVPWDLSSVRGRFFFAPPAPAGQAQTPSEAAPTPPVARPLPSQPDPALELAFWNSIKDSDNANLFREYLRKYPDGHFKAIAAAKIDALTAPPARSPGRIEQPGPSPDSSSEARSPEQRRADFGGEAEDFGVGPQTNLRLENLHAPTPTTVPGAITITTTQLQAMLSARERPLLVDVLASSPDHPTIPGSVWMPMVGTPGSFNDQIQRNFNESLGQLVQRKRNHPIVFFCLGVECWLSYNAALRALRLGYRNVYWYRGGMTAWEDAGLPTEGAAMARW